ncbi:hypothetical protein [Leucobacter sp. M11]|uniref:hypothetical protein n=1 Tax=Leucobacter sp. M11 TaxID=2993565 RepID=UPI002D7ED933|nr:hypothetical protein [Leucobacter sp. M11]MEB4613950.1 hypothetical protein [Leucobacter sp. M11]
MGAPRPNRPSVFEFATLLGWLGSGLLYAALPLAFGVVVVRLVNGPGSIFGGSWWTLLHLVWILLALIAFGDGLGRIAALASPRRPVLRAVVEAALLVGFLTATFLAIFPSLWHALSAAVLSELMLAASVPLTTLLARRTAEPPRPEAA